MINVLRESKTEPEVLEQVADTTVHKKHTESMPQLNLTITWQLNIVEDISGDNTTQSGDPELMYCVVKHYESKKQTVRFMTLAKWIVL